MPETGRFWEQALGSALEEAACFGVSLPQTAEGHTGTPLSAHTLQHPQKPCSFWENDWKTHEALPEQYDLGF